MSDVVLQVAENALARTKAIQEAAGKAGEARDALVWLYQHGPRDVPVSYKQIKASVALVYSSAAHGACEAQVALQRAIQEMWPEITAHAIRSAETEVAELSRLLSEGFVP